MASNNQDRFFKEGGQVGAIDPLHHIINTQDFNFAVLSLSVNKMDTFLILAGICSFFYRQFDSKIGGRVLISDYRGLFYHLSRFNPNLCLIKHKIIGCPSISHTKGR